MGRFNRFLLIPALSWSSFSIAAAAHDLVLPAATSREDLAFARYIASLRAPDPFGAEVVAVTIEAWSPRLHQESRMLMLRRPDASGRSQYLPIKSEGELAATLDLISPYLIERDHLAGLPPSSRATTPANYKFHYLGAMETEGAPAYGFRIVPKQKRDGLIHGQLWIDSQTGLAVAQSGYLVKTPSASIQRLEIAEDTKFDGESAVLRISHIVIETRQDGRGLLTITERRLSDGESAPSEPSSFRPGGEIAQAR
jgi:hypothetical protein